MTTPPPFTLRGDRPIESAEEDRLGRATFARAIAAQILEAPALDSYVVAIMGPWGSGKTSIVNMIAEEARLRSDSVILSFNPWIFSGAEQLVGYFFRELGAQLAELKTDRLQAAGAALRKYAGLFGTVAEWVPAVGGVAKKVSDVAKNVGETWADGPSIVSQRDSIRKQLNLLDQRIVVLVDDIDRLRREEIRELVKLVRLTGDFPNVVYVLAFDRQRVESALGDDDETGRAYLEKIVQVAYDVPIPQDSDITKLLLDELAAATDGIEHGPFDKMDWSNVFHKIIRPLFKSPRDVRRYVNALPPTLRVIGPEVALADVLALEAVRVFLPELFGRLPGMIDVLTAAPGRRHPNGEREKLVKQLVDDAGKHSDVVLDLVQRLFPNAAHLVGGMHYEQGFARQWHRTRRVAAADVFRFYLERRLPEGVVAAAEVQNAFQLLADRNALTELLERLDPVRLENLLGRLEMFEDDFPPEHVEAAMGAVLDQASRLREGKRHFFDLGSDLALTRVVLRLLRRQEDPSERAAIVAHVLPTLNALSARQLLIHVTEGHKLVDPADIAAWKADLARATSTASPEHLAGERQLARLLAEAIQGGHPHADTARMAINNDRVLVRLLTSASTVASTWGMGDVDSTQETRLLWKGLADLFGEEALVQRIREARSRLTDDELDPRTAEALNLGARYASGWRPKDEFLSGAEDSADDTPASEDTLMEAPDPPDPTPPSNNDESAG